MRPKFHVYIDEAGDPGVKPKKKEERLWTDWFTVAAVVVSDQSDSDVVDWVKDMKEAVRSQNNAAGLHYRSLSDTNRARVCRMLGRKRVRIFAVASQKDSMREHYNPRLGRANDRDFYNWCLRLLLERVTEWCYRRVQPHDDKDCSARIVFSKRGGHNYQDLRDYLRKLEAQCLTKNLVLKKKGIAPGVIRDGLIFVEKDSDVAGLQLADIAASAIFHAANSVSKRYNLEPALALVPRLTNAHNSKKAKNAGLLLLPFAHQGTIHPDDQAIFTEVGYSF
jgi:hypothetical protein